MKHEKDLSAAEVAKACGCSTQWVYKKSLLLGLTDRIATVEEMKTRRCKRTAKHKEK